MIYALHPEAALEHLEQIAYYEDKSPGLGMRYHRSFKSAVAKALAQAMIDEGISNVALAKRLGVTEAVVRKLLDLDHRSHIGQVERALAELGRRLEIRVKAA